ncbi:uncharacterized protein JCM10292_001587 [Rhodotorula paludigena]|uniref:uncharacterized protein n=1 Tax=Rhodotorula paludigena TaxID=86838 RepID=UPI003172C7F2
MLGKRPRTGTASDAPTTPSKRPLTAYIPSSKPAIAPVTPSSKAGVTPMLRSLSQKENQSLFDSVPYFPENVQAEQMEQELELDDLGLPIPPPCFDTIDDSPDENSQTAPSRGIPNIYTHASSLLAPSLATSSLSLLGRADQHETLLAFLARRIPAVYASPSASSSEAGPSTPTKRPGPAAMYVSGPPGIGKTALISSVIGRFRAQVSERGLGSEVCVATENCAAIAAGSVGDKAWDRLAEALGVEMETEDEEARALKPRERFERGLQDGRKYLLVLDEIDHLVSPTSASRAPSASQQPDLLNALFALAATPASPLTLIGIANDLTLKALSLSPSPSPPAGKGKGKARPDPLLTPTKPIRLHFKPYAWQELVAIVDQRLSLLASSYPCDPELDSVALDQVEAPSAAPPAKKTAFPLIDKPALERCAKKVATGTGDVRTMLDVVRRSIAAVAHDQSSSTFSSPALLAGLTPATAPKATMKHVSAALSASAGLTAAPSVSARLASLQSGPHQRLALVAVVIALSRLALPSSASASAAQAGLDRSSALVASKRVTTDAAYTAYRSAIIAHEDALRPSALDPSSFVDTLGMVEDLGGFVVVRGRPGSGGSSSPSKKSPSSGRVRAAERGRATVELADSAPFADLVAALSVEPAAGKEASEDEVSRVARRAIERERAAQRWAARRAQLGRDEERRAEMELEGREWERRVLAREEEGTAASKEA